MPYGRRRDIHFFMSDHLLSEPLGGLRECSERPWAPGVLERRGEKPRVRWHDAGIQERGQVERMTCTAGPRGAEH